MRRLRTTFLWLPSTLCVLVALIGCTAAPVSTSLPTAPLQGWQQVFADDFEVDVPRGSFPGPYGDRWLSYDGFPNTSRDGDYDQRIISVQDGRMDLLLQAVEGRPKVAAPVPLVNGRWGGQVYGRFSVRMRADAVTGYGVAFLLWSDANNWSDGEINFPESGLQGVVRGYNHCPGDPEVHCHSFETDLRYTDWHTYTIEWTSDAINYLVDERVVSSTSKGIPNKPMHWVLQLETPDRTQAQINSGHLEIDWVRIDRRT